MNPRPQAAGEAAAGFTLLEFLVALAVAGMVLAATIQVVTGQRQTIQALNERGQLLLTAQRTMAELMARPDLVPGDYQGRDGAMAWRAQVRPVIGPGDDAYKEARRGGAGAVARRIPRVLDVSLRVWRPGGGDFSLASRRWVDR